MPASHRVYIDGVIEPAGPEDGIDAAGLVGTISEDRLPEGLRVAGYLFGGKADTAAVHIGRLQNQAVTSTTSAAVTGELRAALQQGADVRVVAQFEGESPASMGSSKMTLAIVVDGTAVESLDVDPPATAEESVDRWTLTAQMPAGAATSFAARITMTGTIADGNASEWVTSRVTVLAAVFYDGAAVPHGGTPGQIVKRTQTGPAWADGTAQTADLPADLRTLADEVRFDTGAVQSAWRLGSDSADMALADTGVFLRAPLAVNTSVPNENTLGTGISAAAAPAALATNPPRFTGTATEALTLTLPSATRAFVIAFDFVVEGGYTNLSGLLSVKNTGAVTYGALLGLNPNVGLRVASAALGSLAPLAQSERHSLRESQRHRLAVQVSAGANTATLSYALMNSELGSVVQVGELNLTFGTAAMDFTKLRLAQPDTQYWNVQVWQWTTATSPAASYGLSDWISRNWSPAYLAGKIRAPQTTDISRIHFLEAVDAPRVFVGGTEVVGGRLLSAGEKSKLQGELVSSVQVLGQDLFLNTYASNGSITSQTIALTDLVPDDSIGTAELDSAVEGRLLPTGGRRGSTCGRRPAGRSGLRLLRRCRPAGRTGRT